MALPDIEIRLDRVRRLRLTINAIVRLEDALNRSLAEIVENVRRSRIGDLRALLWAALRAEDPVLTLEAVGDLLDAHFESTGTLADIVAAIDAALMRSGLFRGATSEKGGAEGNAG